MMVAKTMIDLFKKAAIVGVLAGIAAVLLGGVLGSLVLPFALKEILLLVVAVALVKQLKNIKLFEIVVLFSAITIVGTIVSELMPSAAQWILSVSEPFTAAGLLMTFIYLEIAMIVKNKIGI
jgi:hypothetical protein